jgi:hypothetical protein
MVCVMRVIFYHLQYTVETHYHQHHGGGGRYYMWQYNKSNDNMLQCSESRGSGPVVCCQMILYIYCGDCITLKSATYVWVSDVISVDAKSLDVLLQRSALFDASMRTTLTFHPTVYLNEYSMLL